MSSKYAQLNEREWLEGSYLDEQTSAPKIAEIVGCSSATVYRALERFGIETRATIEGQSLYALLNDGKWLEQKYKIEEWGTIEIATCIGCDRTAVSRALKNLNIRRRGPSEARRRGSKYSGLRDRKWLETKYLEEKKSLSKVAQMVGCGREAVRRALKRFGIPIRSYSEASKYHKKRGFQKHHTKPEMIFEAICKKNGLPFKYTGDSAFWIENINPDFVECNGKKIAVEIFSYWHDPLRRRRKIRYLQTYNGRKETLKKYGWKMIVFWQEDLEREEGENYVLSELKKEGLI